jgi:hypothetical protein
VKLVKGGIVPLPDLFLDILLYRLYVVLVSELKESTESVTEILCSCVERWKQS